MGVAVSLRCTQYFADSGGQGLEYRGEYNGQVSDGIKQGRGKMTWAEGDEYDGNWIDGVPNGPGVYKYADGGRYQGQFRNGKREGYGVYTYGDGSMYEGQWRDDQYNGNGKVLYKSGAVIGAQWVNGRQMHASTLAMGAEQASPQATATQGDINLRLTPTEGAASPLAIRM
uniref:MORN repeat-containing protein 5 n=1 Tax=Oxyrrhis marina TaxID=2969 RepID=A0A7S3XGY2_OXYMA